MSGIKKRDAQQRTSPGRIQPKSNDLVLNGQLLSTCDTVVFNIISEQAIRYNELTEKAEFYNGIALTERDVNNIALKARSELKGIGDNAVMRVLNSHLIPSYHPFTEYINSIKDMPVIHGTIDKFLKCLVLENDHHPDYLQRIVKKWFGGLMGTLMGSYSVMTLVFIGSQGNGKTTFFRGLLPPELKQYFAESEIAADKDVMARMCTNLIVYNDEFTSKNKTEASQYKQMSSAENFTYRKPYGRIDVTRRRTAVLCGSANEPDVISDYTGNRRVIPVRLRYIDHKNIPSINQVYRELLELHKVNSTWWHLTAEDITFMNADTVQNTAIDEFEERILKWTESDPSGHVSTTEVSRHLAAHDGSYRQNIPKLSRALTRVYGVSCVKMVGKSSVRGYKLKLIGVST